MLQKSMERRPAQAEPALKVLGRVMQRMHGTAASPCLKEMVITMFASKLWTRTLALYKTFVKARVDASPGH